MSRCQYQQRGFWEGDRGTGGGCVGGLWIHWICQPKGKGKEVKGFKK